MEFSESGRDRVNSDFNHPDGPSHGKEWQENEKLVALVVEQLERVSDQIAQLPNIHDNEFIDLLNNICEHNHYAIEYAAEKRLEARTSQ